MKEYKITKSQIECYKLRQDSGMYWADITLDYKGGAGRIQIASDFGNWQYFWSGAGDNFKKFLLSLDIHYTAGKFKADGYFDHEKTIKSYKESILEYRRGDNISSDLARIIYDEIIELEEFDNKDVFVNEAFHRKNLMQYYDYAPEVSTSISPQFKRFWNTAWEAFKTELKNEMELIEA